MKFECYEYYSIIDIFVIIRIYFMIIKWVDCIVLLLMCF